MSEDFGALIKAPVVHLNLMGTGLYCSGLMILKRGLGEGTSQEVSNSCQKVDFLKDSHEPGSTVEETFEGLKLLQGQFCCLEDLVCALRNYL
jgi:hypothetical protein